MKVEPTRFPEVLMIEPTVHADHRGLVVETFSDRRYQDAGLGCTFVQELHSFSKAGVVRGFHFQVGRPQAKLVTVLNGRVLDVVVDIRRGSPTFGLWVPTMLSAEKKGQLFIPGGFAHGFCALEQTDLLYKCSDYYAPEQQRGFAHDDPQLAVPWPTEQPILSARDRALPPLSRLAEEDLPLYLGPPAGPAR